MIRSASRRLFRISKQCLSTARTITDEAHAIEQSDVRGAVRESVEVNGSELHYYKAGLGRHHVLMLPGALGTSMTDFKKQLEGMNKDLFTLVALDPRGNGFSRPPDRDFPDNFYSRDADDAAKVMKELFAMDENIRSDAYSLMGWSDGGISALMLAARYPEKVRKLVVWGANAYITETDIKLIQGVRNLDMWSDRMRERFVQIYGEEYFRKTWTAWCDAYERFYTEKGGDLCKKDLALIQCPTLIIHGEKDSMVDPEHPKYLHEHIKLSQLEYMPEGKHNLHMKYSKEFNSLVERFLIE